MKTTAFAVLSFSFLTTAPVLAATSQIADEEVSTVPKPVEPDARSYDANIDRAVLLPTAMTQPRGTVTYNNYELVLHGVTVGLADRLQVSLSVLPPFVKDMPLVGVAAAKFQLVRSEHFYLAVQGSVGLVAVNVTGGDQYDSSDATVIGGTGLLGTFCFGDGCSTMLSAAATLALGREDGQTDGLLLYGGSLVQRLTEHSKLLVEVTSGGISGQRYDGSRGYFGMDGVLLSYGARLHHGNVAGDVGFALPITEHGTSDFLMGFPFINFSYRWQ